MFVFSLHSGHHTGGKLNLKSDIINGVRTYRIIGDHGVGSKVQQPVGPNS